MHPELCSHSIIVTCICFAFGRPLNCVFCFNVMSCIVPGLCRKSIPRPHSPVIPSQQPCELTVLQDSPEFGLLFLHNIMVSSFELQSLRTELMFKQGFISFVDFMLQILTTPPWLKECQHGTAIIFSVSNVHFRKCFTNNIRHSFLMMSSVLLIHLPHRF
jgi:hypothetical protein